MNEKNQFENNQQMTMGNAQAYLNYAPTIAVNHNTGNVPVNRQMNAYQSFGNTVGYNRDNELMKVLNSLYLGNLCMSGSLKYAVERIDELEDSCLHLEEKNRFLESMYHLVNEQPFDLLTVDLNTMNKELLQKILFSYSKWWETVKANQNLTIGKELYSKYVSFFEGNQGIATSITPKFTKVFGQSIVKPSFITVGAPTGVGKTAFAIMMTTSLLLESLDCNHNKKIIYLSLEQPAEHIKARIKSCVSARLNLEKAISYSEILHGKSNVLVERLFESCNESIRVLDSSDFNQDLTVDSIIEKLQDLEEDFSADYIFLDQYENVVNSITVTGDDVTTKLSNYGLKINADMIVQSQLTKESVRDIMSGKIKVDQIDASCLKGDSKLGHLSTMILVLLNTGKSQNQSNYENRNVNLVCVKNRYGAKSYFELIHKAGLNYFLDVSTEDDQVDTPVSVKYEEVMFYEND